VSINQDQLFQTLILGRTESLNHDAWPRDEPAEVPATEDSLSDDCFNLDMLEDLGVEETAEVMRVIQIKGQWKQIKIRAEVVKEDQKLPG
jgi:hypothetical protein